MTSRRTKISPKSGRGLGHVTPTFFGSTVGYPSDSLASCLMYFFVLNPFLLFAKMDLFWFSSQQAKKMAAVFNFLPDRATQSGNPLLAMSQKGVSSPGNFFTL